MLGWLRPLSLHRVSEVTVAGTTSAVDYGMELTLPGDPVIPEPASVHSLAAALHWFSVRPGHTGCLPFLLTDDDIVLYGFTFTYALLDFVRVVPSDHCFVDEDILAGVIQSDETISILGVTPFDGTVHSMIYVPAQVDNAVLHFPDLYCDPSILC